ncbi:MAG: AAA family ATPase, partial [Prevotellaceae bacterium]|nr:AAA family ATPase [Prevotellaceae bacterium]
MTDIRKLPIGIQNFEKLRTEKYVYIDKTQYVYKLAQTSVPYFIGRPRRFGKSLFLSTLRAYFEGKKHLFEGLAVAELEKEWTEFPVIYIDFNQAAYTSLQTLKNVLNDVLKEYEEQLKIKTEEPEYSLRFKKIIKTAFEQTSRKVVVLVDEYDKPLLGTMDDLKVHEDIRVALRGFYGVLKSMDEYLRFVCLTGVTKFSKVSIFSDLNHLLDISMDEKYAGVCGITEKELLDNFQPELESFAERRKMTKEQVLAEMKKNYDGYLFAPESEGVYNPFSLLNAFHSRIFDSYWFETGTPDMLARRVESENLNPRDFDRDTIISTKELKDYRPGETSIIPLLYQSGYLTIKDYEADYGVYRLGFPNEEVKYGFMRNLLPVYAPAQISTLTSFFAGNFVRSLRNGDTEGFMVQLKAFYASIPYNVVRKKQKNEQHYQFIFYLLFTLMG